jgi:hypothetical protein
MTATMPAATVDPGEIRAQIEPSVCGPTLYGDYGLCMARSLLAGTASRFLTGVAAVVLGFSWGRSRSVTLRAGRC